MRCKNLKEPTQNYFEMCYYGIVKNQLPETCTGQLIFISAKRTLDIGRMPRGLTGKEGMQMTELGE